MQRHIMCVADRINLIKLCPSYANKMHIHNKTHVLMFAFSPT
jgi:hypothetical protein